MGGWYPVPKPQKPVVEPPPQKPDPQFPDEGVDLLWSTYGNLRWECGDLEAWIEQYQGRLSEKELKRLDKAVTVMKVGFKTLKKVARGRRKTISTGRNATPVSK